MMNKRERFKRIAAARTNLILNRIRILGHCANKQAYQYTEKDIEKIFFAIEQATKEVKSLFGFRKVFQLPK